MEDPCHPEAELLQTIGAISSLQDLSEFFCLIPVHQGRRFLEGGYQINSSKIPNLLEGNIENWESFCPHKLPEGIWQCLPEIESYKDSRQQLRSNIYGLINDLAVLRDRQAIIEPIQSSQNTFEAALCSRYMTDFNGLIRDLGVIAAQIKNQLEVDFEASKVSREYQVISSFLEEIEINLSVSKLDKTYLEKIKESVEELLTELTIK